MTTKYIQPGDAIEWTNSTGSAVSADDVVVTGELLTVAVCDIANGSTGTLWTEGVFLLPKETGVSFSKGDLLYWDSANERFDKTSSNRLAGLCFADATSGATTCYVWISKALYAAGSISAGSAAVTTYSLAEATKWTGTETSATYDVSSVTSASKPARLGSWRLLDVEANDYRVLTGPGHISFPDDTTVKVDFGTGFPLAAGTYTLVGEVHNS